MKNAVASKDLEECKLQNCELNQALKDFKHNKPVKPSSSKGRRVPKLDISLNGIEDQPKATCKSHLGKFTAAKVKKIKSTILLNESATNISVKEPSFELSLKPATHQPIAKSRVQTLPLQSCNSSKVKGKRLVENLEGSGYQTHLRSSCAQEDRPDKSDRTSAAVTERDLPERPSLKRKVTNKTEAVELFLATLRKSHHE